jgi:hypothetical protein
MTEQDGNWVSSTEPRVFNNAEKRAVAVGNLNNKRDRMRINFGQNEQPYLRIASGEYGIEEDLKALGISKRNPREEGTAGWTTHHDYSMSENQPAYYQVDGLEALAKLADAGVEIPAASTFKSRQTRVGRGTGVAAAR